MTEEQHQQHQPPSTDLREESGDEFDPNDPEETQALHSCLLGYKFYRPLTHQQITNTRRNNFHCLPTPHRDLLTSPPLSLIQTFTSIDDAIRANSAFVETILSTGCVAFGVDPAVLPDQLSLLPPALRGEVENAVDKVTSVLKQFVRDWSEEGREERAPGYGRVLHALAKRWGVNERAGKRVLVPGAGLGRLALEVAEMGFRAEGNEWSYAMLVGSQFVLNCTQQANQFTIHPFLRSFSLQRSRAAQLRPIPIPDILPAHLVTAHPSQWTNPYLSYLPQHLQTEAANLPPSPPLEQVQVTTEDRISMVSGDFLTCYRPSVAASSFDAVATNFFLDTAADPLAYIDIIWSSLKPGGIWINFGPLLWHFDGKGREGQGGVELTLEEVLAVTEMRGFRIVERESNVLSYYTSDRESMGRWAYQCEFWVAEKAL